MDIYAIREALQSGRTIYDLPLRVTYYARVSTDKEEQLHSLSAQVRYYDNWIAGCPNWQLVPGYVDEGISGTEASKRLRFLRMIEDAQAHRFDFIVTKEISRFSRSTLDSIRYTQQLLQCGVGVLFQSDNINTLLPDAELRLTIMSSIAQDEVRKLSERVKFGFRRAIENGVVLGSDRIWGYRKDAGRLVIVEEEARMVRLIFELYANERLGIRTVADRLTDMGFHSSSGRPLSFSTIRGILANPKYKGCYCGRKSTRVDFKLNTVKRFPQEDWVMYEDPEHVPPIVSAALWDKAQRILQTRSAQHRSAHPAGTQSRYPYSGKLFCAVHHAPFYRSVYRTKSGAREVWQCREYVRSGQKGCQVNHLYTNELDSVLRLSLQTAAPDQEALVQTLLNIYAADDQEGKLDAARADCLAELEELARRKDRLLDLSISGCITDAEFIRRNDGFNQQAGTIREALARLDRKRQLLAGQQTTMDLIRQAAGQQLTFPGGFTPDVVDALLDRAEVLPTDDRRSVAVRLYLRVPPVQQDYLIRRYRGKPSVCTRRAT